MKFKSHLFLLLSILIIAFSSCYDEDKYLPSKLDLSSLLTLTSNDSILVADGESNTYVIAELPIDAKSDKSAVTFVTTKGAFENSTKTISKSATVQSVNGVNKRIAKVKLFSTTKIEVATVEASLGDLTKSVNIRFKNPDYASFLNLSALSSIIPADGSNNTLIIVEQPLEVKDEFTTIVLTTDKGIFENGTKTITKNSLILFENGQYKRKAIATLTSINQPSTATIEAAIKNTSKKITVEFQKAFPESIQLTTSAISILSGYNNIITLTTTLLRDRGIPSQGSVATLRVLNEAGIDIGYFINYASSSDQTGSIINKFTLGNTQYVGKLTIIATSATADGSPLVKTINVQSL